jgi:hypothetical protein
MPDKRNDQIVSSPKEENTSPTFSFNEGAGVRVMIRRNLNYLF